MVHIMLIMTWCVDAWYVDKISIEFRKKTGRNKKIEEKEIMS